MKAGPTSKGGVSISPIHKDNMELEVDEEDVDDEGIEEMPEGIEGERIGAEK